MDRPGHGTFYSGIIYASAGIQRAELCTFRFCGNVAENYGKLAETSGIATHGDRVQEGVGMKVLHLVVHRLSKHMLGRKQSLLWLYEDDVLLAEVCDELHESHCRVDP